MVEPVAGHSFLLNVDILGLPLSNLLFPRENGIVSHPDEVARAVFPLPV